MRRRLLTFCSALSLLLFMVVSVLWVRSCFVGDRFIWNRWVERDGRSNWVRSEVLQGRGGVGLSRVVEGVSPLTARVIRVIIEEQAAARPAPPLHTALRPEYPQLGTPSIPNRLGFAYNRSYKPPAGRSDRSVYELQIVIPYWPVALAASVLPALWLRRLRRGLKAAKAGLCPTCGYDLRATPDRCPECGRTPTLTTTEAVLR